MKIMVRSKFRLTEIREHYYAKDARTLVFEAQYDSTIPEDQAFTKATPTGRLEMRVDNPQALAKFEIGKYYYFDATPAE
jgi:hypothetical protein